MGRGLRNRLAGVLAAAGVLVAGLVVATATPAAAAPGLPAGFVLTDSPSGQGAYDLTDFAYLPDGSMITTGKSGVLAWVSTTGASRTLATIGVYTGGDMGLVGIAVAPDYPSSHIVYTAYDAVVGGAKLQRLSKWTVGGSPDPVSLTGEQVLLSQPQTSDVHGVTGVVAAPDGTVWVSTGDASDFVNVDPLALQSLDLTRGQGKLLHITATGAGVPTNPYYDPAAPTSARSRTYASGFRSPFRFSLDPSSGVPILGDVGWNTWEEVDLVQPGKSYAWPCWEGNGPTPGYTDLAGCAGVTNVGPLWTYNHGTGNTAVTGGVVYTGTSYPPAYQGAYFFGDYTGKRLFTLRFDSAGTLTRAPEPGGFGTDIGGPVEIRSGPNGDIVYADIYSGLIRRLSYAPGNRAPVAAVSTSNDPATRTVTFDGTGSYDLDGDALSYRWDFGDGTTGTGATATATHTYAAPGTSPLIARLSVTDPLGLTGTASTTVVPANNAPVLTLILPPAGTVYRVGDTVPLRGSAGDAEDGSLDAKIGWQVQLLHCQTDTTCHVHPGTVGAGPSFSVPFTDHGDRTSLRVTASVTDSAGQLVQRTYLAQPRQRTLSVTSNVPATIQLADQTVTTEKLTVGAALTVTAAATATDGVATFDSWADGGPRQRQLRMPDSDLTLTASYLTPIDRRYRAEAAFRAVLGSPTGPESGDATLRYRDFTGGRAYWTPATGVHEVHGAILADYLAQGGHLRFGAPSTDESRAPDGVGRFNHFTGTPASEVASVYWTPKTGAHAVYGEIRKVWAALGYERSALGYPTTDEFGAPDGVGRINNFQGGGIYWTPTTAAHEVYGAIYARWSQLGWERSYLGYPTSGEFAIPGGRRNNFQAGFITWDARTGQVVDRRY